MPAPTLIDLIREHLQQHGPCTEHEVHAALLGAGLTTAKSSTGVRNALHRSPATVALPDGRWDTLARRLGGAVLTVRPRALLRDDTLWVHGDLEPFTLLGSHFLLAAGGSARLVGSDIRSLVGPQGWLPPVAAGSLLALQWDGSALAVTPLDSAPDPARVRHVRELLRFHCLAARTPSYGEPPRLVSAVLSAMQEDPRLLAEPVLPLSELLPFAEELSPDTGVWENHAAGRRVTVHLPPRVYDELARRSELLGDRLADYAGMLLGAAADRLTPVPAAYPSWRPHPWGYVDEDERLYGGRSHLDAGI